MHPRNWLAVYNKYPFELDSIHYFDRVYPPLSELLTRLIVQVYLDRWRHWLPDMILESEVNQIDLVWSVWLWSVLIANISSRSNCQCLLRNVSDSKKFKEREEKKGFFIRTKLKANKKLDLILGLFKVTIIKSFMSSPVVFFLL